MIFVIIAVIAGLIGGFMAQAKGKNIALWGILCAFFPIAILILAFMEPERQQSFSALQPTTPPYAPQAVENKPAALQSRDNPAWKTLSEFDGDIQEAIAKLVGFGPQAEERLATAYLSVSDKNLLPSIVAKITADEQSAAVEREEEKTQRAQSMSEREKDLLVERERRAQFTINRIKENGMVNGGKKVLSAEMYYGPTASEQGWAKIVYEDGTTELRAGAAWQLIKA